jgi:hypothetical protein
MKVAKKAKKNVPNTKDFRLKLLLIDANFSAKTKIFFERNIFTKICTFAHFRLCFAFYENEKIHSVFRASYIFFIT